VAVGLITPVKVLLVFRLYTKNYYSEIKTLQKFGTTSLRAALAPSWCVTASCGEIKMSVMRVITLRLVKRPQWMERCWYKLALWIVSRDDLSVFFDRCLLSCACSRSGLSDVCGAGGCVMILFVVCWFSLSGATVCLKNFSLCCVSVSSRYSA